MRVCLDSRCSGYQIWYSGAFRSIGLDSQVYYDCCMVLLTNRMAPALQQSLRPEWQEPDGLYLGFVAMGGDRDIISSFLCRC